MASLDWSPTLASNKSRGRQDSTVHYHWSIALACVSLLVSIIAVVIAGLTYSRSVRLDVTLSVLSSSTSSFFASPSGISFKELETLTSVPLGERPSATITTRLVNEGLNRTTIYGLALASRELHTWTQADDVTLWDCPITVDGAELAEFVPLEPRQPLTITVDISPCAEGLAKLSMDAAQSLSLRVVSSDSSESPRFLTLIMPVSAPRK